MERRWRTRGRRRRRWRTPRRRRSREELSPGSRTAKRTQIRLTFNQLIIIFIIQIREYTDRTRYKTDRTIEYTDRTREYTDRTRYKTDRTIEYTDRTRD